VPDARRPERGQVVPLLLLVLALASASAVVVTRVAVAASARTRAQTAADAAALAGAVAGPEAAEAIAEANGSRLEAYQTIGTEVQVTALAGEARATAVAAGLPAGPDGGGARAGLAPAMLAALDRADHLLGRSVPVVSGYRSRAEQEALWNRRSQIPYAVAPPGTSLHEVGLAIDVPIAEVPTLLRVAAMAGLCQPLPQTDPVHFEPCPPTPP
jgi:hypothetical protein